MEKDIRCPARRQCRSRWYVPVGKVSCITFDFCRRPWRSWSFICRPSVQGFHKRIQNYVTCNLDFFHHFLFMSICLPTDRHTDTGYRLCWSTGQMITILFHKDLAAGFPWSCWCAFGALTLIPPPRGTRGCNLVPKQLCAINWELSKASNRYYRLQSLFAESWTQSGDYWFHLVMDPAWPNWQCNGCQHPRSKGPTHGESQTSTFWRMDANHLSLGLKGMPYVKYDEMNRNPPFIFMCLVNVLQSELCSIFPGANTCHSAPNVNSCGTVFLAWLEAVSQQKPSAAFLHFWWFKKFKKTANHLYC